MKVRILKTDKFLGIKKGEIYKAKPYILDPGTKVELISRIPDGHEPMCTQYRSEVQIIATPIVVAPTHWSAEIVKLQHKIKRLKEALADSEDYIKGPVQAPNPKLMLKIKRALHL